MRLVSVEKARQHELRHEGLRIDVHIYSLADCLNRGFLKRANMHDTHIVYQDAGIFTSQNYIQLRFQLLDTFKCLELSEIKHHNCSRNTHILPLYLLCYVLEFLFIACD